MNESLTLNETNNGNVCSFYSQTQIDGQWPIVANADSDSQYFTGEMIPIHLPKLSPHSVDDINCSSNIIPNWKRPTAFIFTICISHAHTDTWRCYTFTTIRFSNWLEKPNSDLINKLVFVIIFMCLDYMYFVFVVLNIFFIQFRFFSCLRLFVLKF